MSSKLTCTGQLLGNKGNTYSGHLRQLQLSIDPGKVVDDISKSRAVEIRVEGWECTLDRMRTGMEEPKQPANPIT